jgi:transposase
MPRKKFFLLPKQKENLQKALRKTSRPEVRERILMFLLLNDGRTYTEIADFLGCSFRTVAYWCKNGDPNKIESLLDKRSYGNNRKVTESYLDILLETINRQPSEFGYEFSKWTAKKLASHLATTTGIEMSCSQVRNILEKKKIFLPASKIGNRDRFSYTEIIKQD